MAKYDSTVQHNDNTVYLDHAALHGLHPTHHGVLEDGHVCEGRSLLNVFAAFGR